MRRDILAAIAVFAIAGVCSAQMPQNAFLTKPAPTVGSLVGQVQSNPVVMDRYMRHFQMSREEVIRMMNGLRMDTMKEDTTFEVFNVPASTGEIRSRHLLVRRGTRVFVDRSGTPVLLASCGNPLVRMDTVDSGAAPAVSAPMSSSALELPAAAPITTESFLTPSRPIAPEVNFEAPPAPEGTVTNRTTAPASFAAGLGLLPALFVGLNNGGTAVPEPISIFALGTGALLVAARVKRRSR